ncbi:MAG TPA: hypothetical protein VFZ58_03025 [Candidatus Saccharimonadales bacterium]
MKVAFLKKFPIPPKILTVLKSDIFIYIVITSLLAAFFAWRFPNLILYPNFYGEDGSVYLQHIFDKGWLAATFTPFNGYFIVGLYLLCHVAMLVNALLGGDLLTLPVLFSWVAIFFMSAVICLPYLLFRRVFGRLKALVTILLCAVLPLPQTPYAIFGIIGNQKFVFVYLAFLLILCRFFFWKELSLKKIILIDAILLVCAYTSSVTYLLLPVLLWPVLQIFVTHKKRHSFFASLKRILKDKATLSLLGVFVLLIPQFLYVMLNGIPKLSGYLDTPYDFSKTIEIFGNRTLVYAITHSLNQFMSDTKIIVLLIMLLAAGWIALKGRQKFVFFFGIYTAIVSSLLFVVNRPGVSDFFFHYNRNGSGPDQFFFAQTLGMYLPLVLLVFALGALIQKKILSRVFVSVAVAFLFITGALGVAVYDTIWKNAGLYENHIKTLTDQALVQCKDKGKAKIRVYMYTPAGPNEGFVGVFPRQSLCTANLYVRYQLDTQELGLRTFQNKFVTIRKNSELQQTFVAGQQKLNGIKIFLSNFGNSLRNSQYTLHLFEKDCRTVVRSAQLPMLSIDSSYYRAYFSAINDSKNRTYCLGLSPPHSSQFDPLALQLSEPHIYTAGRLTIDKQESQQDIVFAPLYDFHK